MLLDVVNETQSNLANLANLTNFGLTPEVNSLIIGLLLLAVAIIILWKLRHFILNSVLGIIALFLLQFVGVVIPINIVTIVISAVLGLIGVGIMVLLTVLGFSF